MPLFPMLTAWEIVVLCVVGGIPGGLVGYLYGVDLREKLPSTNPDVWAVLGALVGAQFHVLIQAVAACSDKHYGY